MTIKGSNVNLVNLDWHQIDRNEELAYSKGFRDVCVCCGKGIKDIEKSKRIRMIEGGEFYTEDEQELDPYGDMGWFPIGNSCYKKYKANESDIEIN
ncbi:MAG: hypothetical protein IIW71_11710 [Treponema sp.]|nr:hypothetical protein [Treponema sp.]